MNYEKEPLHISTSVPNGTYEVTVTVTAHEDIVFTILSQSRRFMAQDINLGKGESTDITFNVSQNKRNYFLHNLLPFRAILSYIL